MRRMEDVIADYHLVAMVQKEETEVRGQGVGQAQLGCAGAQGGGGMCLQMSIAQDVEVPALLQPTCVFCSTVFPNPQVVEPKKAIVDADVKVAEEAAAAANAIKKECEDALAEAIPILNSAISALDTIKSADIKLVQVGGRRVQRDQAGRTGSTSWGHAGQVSPILVRLLVSLTVQS